MRNLKITSIGIILCLIISCRSGIHIKSYFLHIKNNTAFAVQVKFIDHSDSTSIKEFFLPPKTLLSLDTSKYKHTTDGSSRSEELITGEAGKEPYWKNKSVSIKYKFEDFKETVFQTCPGGQCDSASLTKIFLCNFVKRETERIEATEDSDLEIIENSTFYITQQQLALADSI